MRNSFSSIFFVSVVSMAVLLLLVQSSLPVLSGTNLAAGPESSDPDPEAERAWTPVAPGIEYREYLLPAPNRVFVARMQRSDPGVTLESSIGQGRLSGGVEKVSDMAARYEQTLSYWGGAWGSRNEVVVAINGYFFGGGFEPPGVPWRGQIHSGWYAKRFDNVQNGSGFVWMQDRSAFIGECVNHVANKQTIEVQRSGKTIEFQGINISRGSDEFIIYTPQYDSSTLTDSSGVEMLVELDRPMVIPSGATALGTVRTISNNQGSTVIPFDHIVLSATGSKKSTLLSELQEGDQIEIHQKVKHLLEEDCNTNHPLQWDGAFAGIGGSFYFLEDGFIKSFSDPGANSRAPRTAIAFNADYIFFFVVDGRNPGWSEGMTTTELGLFARDTLGASFGISQDGGGSSTMVVNGEVKNNVYCNTTFCSRKVFLPIVTGGGGGGAPMVVADYQRPVANGMMMVRIEPAEKSTQFSAGEPIETFGIVNLYLGPGENYAVINSLAPGAGGTILSHNLNGMRATGSHWWKAIFSGQEGWVKEQDLFASR